VRSHAELACQLPGLASGRNVPRDAVSSGWLDRKTCSAPPLHSEPRIVCMERFSTYAEAVDPPRAGKFTACWLVDGARDIRAHSEIHDYELSSHVGRSRYPRSSVG